MTKEDREESVRILKMLIPKDSRGNGKVKTNIAITEAILNAVEALEQEPSIDELRVEITALQNRCYALTKGVMCGFCNYECQYKVDRSVE